MSDVVKVAIINLIASLFMPIAIIIAPILANKYLKIKEWMELYKKELKETTELHNAWAKIASYQTKGMLARIKELENENGNLRNNKSS